MNHTDFMEQPNENFIEKEALFVFDGNLNKSNLKKLYTKKCLSLLKVILIIGIIIDVAAVIVGILVTKYAFAFLGLFVCFEVVMVFLPVFEKDYFDKIIITKDILYGVDKHRKNPLGNQPLITQIYLENINKIVEEDDSFILTFGKYGYGYIICQKNLMIKGALSEFIEFFEEYIES